MEGGRSAGGVRAGELTFACLNSLIKKTAMRKILFILTMVASLSASVASAQQRCDSHHEDRPCYEHRGRHHRSPYFVSENKVFFDDREIKGASASGFSILRDGYAKDTWSVYYCGAKMDGASSNSFKVLGYGYAKDTWNVYYDGCKIDGASSDSFDVLSDCYAKDTWNVYFDGKKINGASSDSFKVLSDGYAKDTWSVYFDAVKDRKSVV